MEQRTGNIWLFAAKTALFFAIVGVFFIGQFIFYRQTIFFFWGNVIVILLYTANLLFTGKVYNAFNFGSMDVKELLLSWGLCLFIANVLQYLMLSLIREMLLPVTGFLLILLTQAVLTVPMIILIDRLYYRIHPAHKAIIIYGDEDRAYEYRNLIESHRRKFEICWIAPQSSPQANLLRFIEGSDSVFFLDVNERIREPLLEHCFKHGKRTYIMPTFSNVLINTAGISWISNTPMLLLEDPEPDVGTRFIKRVMDITLSLLALLMFSWLMLIIWILIRLNDNHPAIYKQVRVTKGGRQFTLLKFRSMRPDAEDDGIPRLTAKDDKRITPIGRFIRKTRIDEFPQLLNVLSGAMSLVGPRPERPEIAKQYEEIYPNFSFRTKVKAGMTGFAQIYGRYNTAPEEKLFLDIMYIEKMSIWQDIKLLLQTLKIVFKTSSTEGIEKNSTTAIRNTEKEDRGGDS